MRIVLTSFFLLIAGSILAQTDILDARTNYGINDEVTVTGIVTNDNSLGSVRYIQDETAGIAIYPGSAWTGFTEPQIGDEITVTGLISEYNGLLEVGPSISEVIINSTSNPLPTPAPILASDADESLEGMLVTVEGAVFAQGGVIISGNNTYDFTAAGESGVIYIRTGNYLVGELLPAGEVTIVGIVSQYDPDNSGDGYQLLPRTSDDLIPSSAINIASVVNQVNITTTSFSLEWLTDNAGDSKVEYGSTLALGSEVYAADAVTDHSLELTGLEPGTIYYCQVTSTAGEDMTQSNIQAFATVSESSGEILAYFNHEVDTSVATEELAINLGADMNDTIAAYITRAQHTLDIAAYNINNDLIVNAINEAQSNGVQIRYIAHSGTANIGIGSFNAGIPVIYRPDDEGSGMHNKFIIIDADYTDLAFVLTGSTNLTTENLVNDPNNLIIFQDQSLARGFTLEFNEMWGSDGPDANEANAKFGPNKSINTPKKFIIGGSEVELYFSPTDGTTAAIEAAIYGTEYDLEFALLAFTRDDLGDAVMAVGASIFINPVGIIEQINSTGSEYQALLDAGIDVYSHQGVSGQLHHKFAVIDHSQPLADPVVITGSHNWSTSAETINDENTVFVHDARIANIYHQAFSGLLQTFVSVEEITSPINFTAYPNPASETLYIHRDDLEFVSGRVLVFDLSGKKILDQNINTNVIALPVADLQEGAYLLRMITGNEVLLNMQFIKH